MSTGRMYDGSVLQYQDCVEVSACRPVEARCVLHVAGPLTGLDGIDLGCGTGWYGRQVLAGGARRALGVDCTPDMLAQARQLSREGGDAMTFVQGDLRDLRDLRLREEFDIAIASWVFCHATTALELAQMYCAAASVLRPGGTLVAVVNNPAYRLQDGDGSAYGAKAIAQEPHPDADRLTVEFAGEPPIRVVDYQWGTGCHQAAATAAGFGALSWHCPTPDPSDRAAFPPGFWDEYERNPASTVLRCVKTRGVTEAG